MFVSCGIAVATTTEVSALSKPLDLCFVQHITIIYFVHSQVNEVLQAVQQRPPRDSIVRLSSLLFPFPVMHLSKLQ